MSPHTVTRMTAARAVRRLRPRPAAPASRLIPPNGFLSWYLGLVPYWLGVKSRLERRLLLRTHQWILERVLAPEVGLARATADLDPDGDLTRILTELVPAEVAGQWRHFIRVVVASLRRALDLPVTRRNEAWVRWLFLIPYRARASAHRQPAAR